MTEAAAEEQHRPAQHSAETADSDTAAGFAAAVSADSATAA